MRGKTQRKKARLLELAAQGAVRPHYRHSLGDALYRYTGPSQRAYDLDFDQKIRQLRPDWFLSSADKKKAELLRLARSGADKPKMSARYVKGELGAALSTYTRKSQAGYDPEFDGEIRKLRPDWFR